MDVEKVLRRLAHKQTVNLGYRPDLRTGVENPILDSLYKSLRESGLEEVLRAGQAMRDWRPAAEDGERWDAAARKLEGQD